MPPAHGLYLLAYLYPALSHGARNISPLARLKIATFRRSRGCGFITLAHLLDMSQPFYLLLGFKRQAGGGAGIIGEIGFAGYF